jgi:choice-of-anchor C domain-containing protein
LDHARVSDLALTLISPTGKRILLYEDRGGNTAQNLGSGSLITNNIPTIHPGSGSAPDTNSIGIAGTSGTLLMSYDFENIPDQMWVLYDGVTIKNTGLVSGAGNFSVNFGPGVSTNLVIIMNPNTGNSNTVWSYTPTIVSGSNFSYFTFTENTNLAQVPVKYFVPPFSAGSNAITTFSSGFETASATNYNSGQIVDGWTVVGNPVKVINDATLANGGSQCLALQLGVITRVLPTVGGRNYALSYAYRQDRPLDINGSFETPVVAGTFNPAVANIDGWTAGYGNVDHIGTYWTAANGINSVDLNGTQPGSLYRDISTLNGQIYDLRFAYAANPDRLQTNSIIQVSWAGANVTNSVFNNTGFSRANMGWKYAQNQVLGTGTNRLQFGSTNSGDWGPALDDVSLTPRATAAVVLNGTQMLFGQQSWQTNSVAFTSSGTGTPVTLVATNGGGGMLLDSFTLTQSPEDPFVFPEQSLEDLVGDYADGTWTLEIRDSRTGMTNNAQLLSWQLRFLFENNMPVPTRLIDGVVVTNIIPACEIAYFTVDVPPTATAATNILLSSSVPVIVWFNQNTPPGIGGTNPGDFALIPTGPPPGATNGTYTLLTNGTPPLLLPGQRYYLGVENPCVNGTNAVVALQVNFNSSVIPPSTNFFISSITPTNIGGTNGFLLIWFAPTNDLFQVEWTPTLSPAVWSTFTNIISYSTYISPTNSQFMFFDDGSQTGGFGSTRFYRLRLLSSGGTSLAVTPLANGIPLTSGVGAGQTNYFSFAVTNSDSGVLFELYNLNGNGDLFAQTNGLPSPASYFASSTNSGTNYEQIVIRTNSTLPLISSLNGTWFLSVPNNDPASITYTIRAVLPVNGMLVSGLPINTGVSVPGGTNVQLNWGPTVVGEKYQVQTNVNLGTTNWGILANLSAGATSMTFIDPSPISASPTLFYRVVQVP